MRAEKKLWLKDLQSKVEGATSVVVTQYQGLNASQAEEFRGMIAKCGGDFEVVRKRVLIKAAEAAGLEFNLDELVGHVGIAYTRSDAIELAKAVYKFRKDNDGVLDVLGGYFENEKVAAEQLQELSSLPSKDVLRSQILGLFEAPMAQTVSVMNAVLTSVMHCMQNKIEKEEN